MKRFVIAAAFACVSAVLFGIEANVELESNFLYTTYIKNETFSALTQTVSVDSLNAYQLIGLKLRENINKVRLVFDARFFYFPASNELRYEIDNAYFQVPRGASVLYAGKQRIRWGTGYAWNPSDKLQQQTLVIDTIREAPGIYGVRFDRSGGFLSSSFIVSPSPAGYAGDWGENFTLAAQLYKLIGTADVFVNSIYRHNSLQTIGAALSWDTGLFVLNFEGAAIRYMERELNLLRYTGRKSTRDVEYDFTAGINRTLGDNGMLVLEYYRHNWGIGNDGFADAAAGYEDDPALLNFLRMGAKKDYAALSLSWNHKEAWAFNASAIFGLNDGSIIAYPSLSYVENNNWDFTAGYIHNFSERRNPEGYYALPFYNTVEMKIRAYF
ncbi:MAG TPA: hypothetical protein ENN43_04710 [bacterium]|nr:hypothetical protein [bacterium]